MTRIKNKARPTQAATINVAPNGNDRWAGGRPTPNRQKTDGPLATLESAWRRAQALARRRRGLRPIRIALRGGHYFLRRPLKLKMAACRSMDSPLSIVFGAFQREKPIISGGRRITNWKIGRRRGHAVWVAHLPEVKRGAWYFRQLWVNGRRAPRPTLPRKGEYRVARVLDAGFTGDYYQTVRKGANRFGFAKGQIRADWKNLADIELLFFTLWVGVRANLKAVDTRRRIAVLDRNSGIRLTHDHTREGARYVIENVFEALAEPGQWYLDRGQGLLYYLPLPGETPATADVVAPVLSELVRIEGPAKAGRPAPNIRFERIAFAHSEWTPAADDAVSQQAAQPVPGAVSLKHVSNCEFRHCEFAHLGGYAVELTGACAHNRIVGCRLRDLGGGGVKIWHGCRENTIADCEISRGGRIYPGAVGVLVGNAGGNRIVHNHIYDLYYTAISIGWTWGYAASSTCGNAAEWNHIHRIGQGKLNDMGGIYTVGIQPGTRFRYNLIHDVECRTYGGWGIYPDEGSSRILVESNICHHCQCGFHQHFGRDNILRNNIFALGTQAQIALSRPEPHRSLDIRGNIVYYTRGLLWKGPAISPANAVFERNLYWRTGGSVRFETGGRRMGLRAWQRAGHDRGSLEADPRFVNPEKGDFRFRRGSPYARIGFIPFDLSAVGPRTGTTEFAPKFAK